MPHLPVVTDLRIRAGNASGEQIIDIELIGKGNTDILSQQENKCVTISASITTKSITTESMSLAQIQKYALSQIAFAVIERFDPK